MLELLAAAIVLHVLADVQLDQWRVGDPGERRAFLDLLLYSAVVHDDHGHIQGLVGLEDRTPRAAAVPPLDRHLARCALVPDVLEPLQVRGRRVDAGEQHLALRREEEGGEGHEGVHADHRHCLRRLQNRVQHPPLDKYFAVVGANHEHQPVRRVQRPLDDLLEARGPALQLLPDDDAVVGDAEIEEPPPGKLEGVEGPRVHLEHRPHGSLRRDDQRHDGDHRLVDVGDPRHVHEGDAGADVRLQVCIPTNVLIPEDKLVADVHGAPIAVAVAIDLFPDEVGAPHDAPQALQRLRQGRGRVLGVDELLEGAQLRLESLGLDLGAGHPRAGPRQGADHRQLRWRRGRAEVPTAGAHEVADGAEVAGERREVGPGLVGFALALAGGLQPRRRGGLQDLLQGARRAVPVRGGSPGLPRGRLLGPLRAARRGRRTRRAAAPRSTRSRLRRGQGRRSVEADRVKDLRCLVANVGHRQSSSLLVGRCGGGAPGAAE
mmetsp:Transcript_10216/g.35770  ORF Transcript_10216/g.35770 Transcript_10216/m.35770 type:complete len:490 (+) Transcript_10216:3077-4546(+)